MTPTAADHGPDRAETARLVLNLGLAAAILPPVLAIGAWLAFKAGLIDWWTAYGQVLIGDGGLSLALQAAMVALLAAAAGLVLTLRSEITRFYPRAMLNLGLSAAGLWVLVLLRGA